MKKSCRSEKQFCSLRRLLIYLKYHTDRYISTAIIFCLLIFTTIWLMRNYNFVKCESRPEDNQVQLEDNIHIESLPNSTNTRGIDLGISTPKKKTPRFHQTDESSAQFSVQERLKISEQIYQRSVKKRQQRIDALGGSVHVNPWKKTGSVYYWDYFTPSFVCPHYIERVGRIGDGGKWLCGLQLFEIGNNPTQSEKCIIYSFGVANSSSFEAELIERTPCEIHAFDYSVDKLGFEIQTEHIGTRIHFNKIGLSHKDLNTTFQTLGSLMGERYHDWIDILKIDIEGNEFPCLEQIMEEFPQSLPFGQLLIELHVDNFGRGFKSVLKWWEKLESIGLRPFMNEVNHDSCVLQKTNPIAVEYSFLNLKGNRNRMLN